MDNQNSLEPGNIIIFKTIYNSICNRLHIKYLINIKTNKTLNKINTLYTKYAYSSLLDVNYVFFLSQKHYFCLYNFIKRIKYKRYKIYNKYDINYDTINDNDTIFNVYIDKFIYRFTIPDIINIIKYNLYYYTDASQVLDNENISMNITIQCNTIKNPYTNKILPLSSLYNLYNMLYFNKIKIPYVLLLFYKSQFNLINFNFNNREYIVTNTFKVYINNIDNQIKISYLKIILIDFLKYLHVNFDYYFIKNKIKKVLLNQEKIDELIKILDSNNGINIFIYYDLLFRYYINNNLSHAMHYRLLKYNLMMTNKFNILKQIFGVNKSIMIYIILCNKHNDMHYRDITEIYTNINYQNEVDIIENSRNSQYLVNNIIEEWRLCNTLINYYYNNYSDINRIVNTLYIIFKLVNTVFITYNIIVYLS